MSGSDARLAWIPDGALLEGQVGPWRELPLWISQDDMTVTCARAMGARLRFRPLAETIRDALRWDSTPPADAPRQAGLGAQRANPGTVFAAVTGPEVLGGNDQHRTNNLIDLTNRLDWGRLVLGVVSYPHVCAPRCSLRSWGRCSCSNCLSGNSSAGLEVMERWIL